MLQRHSLTRDFAAGSPVPPKNVIIAERNQAVFQRGRVVTIRLGNICFWLNMSEGMAGGKVFNSSVTYGIAASIRQHSVEDTEISETSEATEPCPQFP